MAAAAACNCSLVSPSALPHDFAVWFSCRHSQAFTASAPNCSRKRLSVSNLSLQ